MINIPFKKKKNYFKSIALSENFSGSRIKTKCSKRIAFISNEFVLFSFASDLSKQLNVGFPKSENTFPTPFSSFIRGGCPLCDRSVYSYCSQKLVHDECCCNAG